MKINITFPDSSVKKYNSGISALEIAEKISHQLALRTICAEVNDRLIDITTPITEDSKLILHTFDTEKGKKTYWHSTAHVMAQAVQELWPEVKVTIGPSIENGFYYDFDRDQAFSDEDLKLIEDKISEISKRKLRFSRKEITRTEALKLFEDKNETYKVEILKEIPDNDIISIYQQGDFIDLCRGPHILHTGKIKAVKLLKTSGAYWRGDEKRPMLQRIYGTVFFEKKELKDWVCTKFLF